MKVERKLKMDNNTNELKGTNKKLIVPFIAISLAMVLLIAGGLSYAYFTWWGSVSAVTSVATGNYPTRCVRDCRVESAACPMTITYAGMGSSAKNSTTPKFTSTCYVNVGIRGIAGTDKVNYSVGFKAGTPSAANITGYTWSAGELTYVPNGGTAANLFAVNTTGVTVRAAHDLAVAGTAGACNSTYTYENTTVVLRFYNLDKNQTPLTSLNFSVGNNAANASHHDNKATTLLKYYMYTPAFTCSIS